jgi:hypothetical protein
LSAQNPLCRPIWPSRQQKYPAASEVSVVAFHRDHDESAQLGAAVKVAEQSVSREVLDQYI